MSAEIKSGAESCKSTIEHETVGILRCQGLHQRQAFPTVHGNGQHGWDDSDPRIIPPTPWRFDVPAVPDHVMAMTGPGDGGPRVWVRGQRRRWAEWPLTGEPDEWISLVEVIYRTGYGGLVECPDPRAAS